MVFAFTVTATAEGLKLTPGKAALAAANGSPDGVNVPVFVGGAVGTPIGGL
jgi:hypothetical protein